MEKIALKKTATNLALYLGNKLRIKWRFYYLFIAAINIMMIAKNWPSVLSWHVFKKGGAVTVRLRNGTLLNVSGPADLSMLTEIWAIEQYTPQGFEIKRKDVIIDVGAHVGFFSVYAARYAPEGMVISFEPLPANYENLKKNIFQNGIKNIRPFNLAVAMTSGVRDFYEYEGHNGCHSLYFRGNGKKIEVSAISLKEVLVKNKVEHCNILKMDCEGAEFEILLNTDKAVFSKIDKIVGELHTDIQKKYGADQLLKHLDLCGYAVTIDAGMFYATRKPPNTTIL